MKYRGWIAACLVWIAALTVGIYAGAHREPPTRLTFLSVGQGDCTVFQTDGTTILIDAGPANEYSDAGSSLVVPALKRLGVYKIDLVILTHPDLDHVGGLRSVSRRMNVHKIAMAKHFQDKPEVKNLLRECRLGNDQVMWLSGHSQAKVGSFDIQVETPCWTKSMSDNDGSLEVRVYRDKASCVITGDASETAEMRFLSDKYEDRAQILKVGHHGSSKSTSEAWIERVRPMYSIVSVGRNNRYGHPSKEVVKRLERAKSKVLRTDREGDLRFVAGQNGFEREKGQ